MHQQLNKCPRPEQWIIETAFEKKKKFSFQAAKKTPKHKPPTNQEQNPNTLAEKQTRRKPPKSKPVKFLFLY